MICIRELSFVSSILQTRKKYFNLGVDLILPKFIPCLSILSVLFCVFQVLQKLSIFSNYQLMEVLDLVMVTMVMETMACITMNSKIMKQEEEVPV